MSFKDVALALNEYDKSVKGMPESPLKKAHRSNIENSLRLLLNERVKANQARNFKLQQPGLKELESSSFILNNSQQHCDRRKYY